MRICGLKEGIDFAVHLVGRYREFRALQDALKKTFPVVGQQLHHKMQSKMADRLEHFRRFADSVVEKRRNMLQAYLQVALTETPTHTDSIV